MNLRDHILQALREQVDDWQALLSSLGPQQVLAPLAPSTWAVKDVLAHLAAWQLRSQARIQAALTGSLPVFPQWVAGVDPDGGGSPDEVNALIYAAYQHLPWQEVHSAWRAGYLRLIESSRGLPERDLFDGSHYPWMGGYPLVDVLTGTYDHHLEHYDSLIRLQQA